MFQTYRVVQTISFFIGSLFIIAILPQFLSARSLAEIKRTQEARVCVASSIKFMNDFSKKQAELFFSTIDKNIKIRFKQITWDEMFHNDQGKTVQEGVYTPKLLAGGQCDLYPSNLTETEWRKKKMAFAIEYVARNMVIVNRSQQSHYKTVKDLGGKTAAITASSSYYSWLKEQNQTIYSQNPVKFKFMDASDALPTVNEGQADFTLYDGMYSFWASRKKYTNTAGVFPVGALGQIGWAVRKDDQDLLAAIKNFFFSQLRSNESPLNQIWKNHLLITLTEFNAIMTAVQ